MIFLPFLDYLQTDYFKLFVYSNLYLKTFITDYLFLFLFLVRRLAAESSSIDSSYLNGHVRIRSENNFPTAGGLASSVAGYACLGK